MSVTKLAMRIACIALAGSFAVFGAAALAEQPSATQMIDALKAKPLTRSLNGPKVDPAKAARERSLIDSPRGKTRAISIEERKEVAEIAKDKPQINLEVTFDYNSAVINVKALPLLADLGKALSSPELK